MSNYLNRLGEKRIKTSLFYSSSGISIPIASWIFGEKIIRGIFTTETGIVLLYSDNTEEALLRANITSDMVRHRGNFDISFTKYVNSANVNPNRIIVKIINKQPVRLSIDG
jgi:hypothetical protein